MEPRLSILLATLCLLGTVTSVPRPQSASRCAATCSGSQNNFKYEVGKSYVYDYESWTKLELGTDNNDGPKVLIKASAQIAVLAPCELALRLTDVRVSGPVDTTEYRTALEANPLLFSFDEGKIADVCEGFGDEQWVINLKKGLLSALQVSAIDSDSKIVTETDVMGDCETRYEIMDRSYRGIRVKKSKDMKSCGRRHSAIGSLFPSSYASPDFAVQSLPVLGNEFSCELLVSQGIVDTSRCVDKNSFLPLSWAQGNGKIETITDLKLKNQVNGLLVSVPVADLNRHQLLFASNPMPLKTKTESEVKELLTTICSKIQDEIEPEVPQLFGELVHSLRALPEVAVGRIYQLVERRSICSSPKLMDIFSDALIMDSSAGSLKLLSEMVLSGSMSKPMSDYLLTMLAFANRPSESAIEALLPVIESRTPSRQAMLGVSALIHNFCVQTNCDGNRVVRRAANAILAQVGRRCNGEQAVVALKALANIGVPEFDVEKVLNCVGTSPSDVEIAALEALEGVCDRKTMGKAMELLKNSRLTPEVRIHAYKVLISCPSRQVVDEIVEFVAEERCNQVVAFIGSHLKNVQRSSDPKKAQLRELLVPVTVRKFPKDIRRFSRYFELSHLFERANLGGVMNTEVIYDHSFVPRSVVLNVTVPAFGKSFNFVEVGVRQVGFESKIESIIGPQGALRSVEVPQFLKNVIGSVRPPPAVTPKKNLADHVFKGRQMNVNVPEKMSASMYVKLDGKTIFFVDEKDVPQQRNQIQAVASKLQLDKVKRFLGGRQDSAMSFMFLDNEHVFSASNGMPLKIALNGTAIVGYKSSETQLTPSFATQMSAKITFDMKNSKHGVQWIGAASASPSIRFELTDNKLRLSLPKTRNSMVRMNSKIVILDGQRSERLYEIPSRTQDFCSGSFLDMKMCAKLTTPNTPWNSMKSLAGNWELDWNIQREGADALEFTLELPSERDSRKTYKLAFAAPGGRVSRDTHALVAFELDDPSRQEIKVELKCPKRSMKMHALKVMTEENVLLKLTSIINERDTYEAEAALDTIRRGRKTEWQPRVALVLPGQSPKSLTGSFSLEEGRKSRVSIRLTSHAGTEIIRGTLVKDGSLDGRFKVSADVGAELGFLNMRLFGAAHKTDASISNDISIEYSTPSHRRPQTAKLVAKLQNLSTRSLKKLTSFLEITSTEFPSTNFHINWNLLFKPLEHVENEGIIMWGDDFRDSNRKIKILQVTKLNGFSSDGLKTVENMLSVDIRPLRIDYELQLNGHLEKGELPKFKLETRAHERRARKEYSAGAEYSTLSRTPLRLSMGAHVKVPAVADVQYTDSITESSPGEYHGQSGLRWDSNKQAKLDYFYRIKSNAQKMHHELDWSLEHPSLVAPIRHQALLRLTRHELEVRSKANSGASEIWEAKAELNKRGNSEVYLNTKTMSGKLASNPFSTPAVHSIELVGKSGKTFSHRSQLEHSPSTFLLNSKTMHDSQPLVVVKSNVAQRGLSTLSVETTPLKAKVEFSPSPMTGAILLSTDRSVHKSAFSADSNSLDLTSKTQSNGKLVANIQGSLKKRGASSLKLETSRWTGSLNADPEETASLEVNSKHSDYTHRTDISPIRQGVKFTSKTMKNQQQLLGVDSVISRNAGSHLSIETVPVSGRLEVDPNSYEKSLNFKLTDNRRPREHVTEIKILPKRSTIMSKTVSDGASVARVDGGFDSLEHHHIKVNTPAMDVAWLRRRHQAKLNLAERSSGIDHNTELELHPTAWNLLSKTTKNGEQMALLKGQITEQSKQLRVQVPNAEAAFQLTPKMTEVELQAADMTHKTVLAMNEPQTLTIDSLTTKKNRDVLTINSKLSRRSDSHVDMIASPIRASVKLNPWHDVKTLEIEGQHYDLPLVHKTKLIADPMFVSIDSNTDYERRPALTIGSKLSRAERSYVNIKQHPSMEASFEVDPFASTKNGRFEIKKDRFEHWTKVNYSPERYIAMESESKQRGSNLLSIDSKVSHGDSHFKVNTQNIDGSLRVSANRMPRSISLDVSGRALTHKSEIKMVPSESLEFESQTHDSGRQIADIRSRISRQVSKLSVDTEPIRVSLEVDPSKRYEYDFECKKSGLTHSSALRMVPDTLIELKSRAERDSQPIYKLDGEYKPQMSVLKLESQHLDSQVKVQPKEVSFELKGKKLMPNHVHKTILKMSRNQFIVESRTSKRGQNIAAIDSTITTSAPSTLNIQSTHGNAQVTLEPFGTRKTARWTVSGQRLNHNLDAVLEPEQLSLESDTQYANKNIFNVKTNLQRGDSFVAVRNQLFDGRVDMKPSERLFQVDYTAKHGVQDRRILGSVQNKNQNNLVMDVAWDKDRNSDARLKLTLDNRGRSDKHQVDVKAEYGSEHFVTIKTKLTKRSILAGPHDIEVDVNMPQHPVKIIVHHEMANGKMNCVARYLRDGEEKIEIQNNADYQLIRDGGYSLNGEVTVKSAYQYLDNMRFKVNSELAIPAGGQISSKSGLIIQLPNESPIELEAQLERASEWRGGSISGSLKAVTPIFDYKNQELSAQSTWTSDKINVDGKLVALGKRAELKSGFQLTRDGFESKLDIDSDFEMIPKLSAESRLASTGSKSKLELKANSERVEIVNLDVEVNMQSMTEFQGQASLSSKWTPKFEAELEGKLGSRLVKYALEVKQDGRPVAQLELNGQQSRTNVEGQAFLTIKSEKMIDIKLNSENGQTYTLNIEATGNRQIKFTFEPKQIDSKHGFLFSVCPRGSPCATFEAIVSDPRSNTLRNMDQEIKLTFKRADTEYGFDWAIVMNREKTVNRMMVDWNGKRLGVNMNAVNSHSGHSELLVQVFLPQRVMELRGQTVSRGDRNQMTLEVLTDAENNPESKLTIEFIHVDQVSRFSRGIESSMKISHPVLRRPLVSTFSFQQNESQRSRPLAAQLILDLAANPNSKLIFEAELAHPENDQRNTSLSFGVHRPDRRSLDFSSSVHVGLNEDVFTSGMEWSWMSRSNQKVEGFYFVEADARNQALHVIMRCPLTNLDVRGNWDAAHDQQGLSFNGFVKLNGVQRRAIVTALTSKPGCVQMTLLKEREQVDKKWEVCANFERIGKQFIKLSAANLADQIDEDDVSATFYQQSPKAYRFALKWEPKALGQMMKAAMSAAESVDIRMPNTNELKQKVFGEGRREVVDKVNNVADLFMKDIVEPSQQSLTAEVKKIAQELDIDEAVLEPVYAAFSTLKDFVAQVLNVILPNDMNAMMEDALESINVKAAALCARNEFCSSLAYKYERHGWQGVRSMLSQKSRDYLGSFDTIEWMQKKIDDLINGPSARRLNEVFMNMTHEMSEQLQTIVERLEKAIAKFDDCMLKSQSLAEPYKMIREIALDAKDDVMKMMDQVEWEQLEKLYLYVQRMFTSTDFWKTRARFVTWNPENGEIVLELRSPVHPATLKSIWNKPLISSKPVQLTSFEKLNALKANLWNTLLPPFRAQAMLVGGRHFVTFDRQFYDFEGSDCSYLLAKDFADGNFTAVVKYHRAERSGRPVKTLIIQTNDQVLEVIPHNAQVKLDGRLAELPLTVGSTVVRRRGASIIVDDSHDVVIECALEHDVCTVSVSGFYFGKTHGLFGSLDYEKDNDLNLPSGVRASRPADLAAAWKAAGSCRSPPALPSMDSKAAICSEMFDSELSSIRSGFGIVDPEPFTLMCHRHVAAASRYQEAEKSACEVSAAYLKSLRFHGLPLAMPSRCLKCDNGKVFGSRFRPQITSAPKADIVFVVEEKACNQRVVEQLGSLSRIVERDLLASGISNVRFGVVGFGQQNDEVHLHTARHQPLFTASDLVLALERMELEDGNEQPMDTFAALQFAAEEYRFRDGASKNLILLSCSRCSPSAGQLSYTDMQHLLASEGITLHTVGSDSLQLKGQRLLSKSRGGVFAFDARSVYDAKSLASATFKGRSDLRAQIAIPKDVCVALATESGGSFFSSAPLATADRMLNKQWMSVFAQRLAVSASPVACQKCDCIMDADLLHSKTVCRPCKPRSPAF